MSGVLTLFGLFLVLIGGVLVRRHRRQWSVQQSADFENARHEYAQRRYRLRMMASCILMVLGFMLPLGHFAFENRPALEKLAAVYWLVALAFCLAMVVLAVLDLSLTGTQTRDALADVQRRKRELEEDLKAFRKQSGNRDG